MCRAKIYIPPKQAEIPVFFSLKQLLHKKGIFQIFMMELSSVELSLQKTNV